MSNTSNNSPKKTSILPRNKMSNGTTYQSSTSNSKHFFVKRIRTPHPHDVLSGRGGGVNSHHGNQVFREWVRQRKEDYNLAPSKLEKARIANDVIALVRSQNPPGRFLQRDPAKAMGPNWWVEVDEVKTLAKTSQALREGAPQIRAAHQPSGQVKKRKRKSSISSKQPTETPRGADVTMPREPVPLITQQALASLQQNVLEAQQQKEREELAQQTPYPSSSTTKASSNTLLRPLMSNQEFEQRFPKKVRVELPLDRHVDTPPLTPVPFPAPPKNNGMLRENSLALSDWSMGDFTETTQGEFENDHFINPFAEEESDSRLEQHRTLSPRQVLRNISSDEATPNGTRLGNGNNIINNDNHRNNGSTGNNSWSTRSISELSDLPSFNSFGNYHHVVLDDHDFGEGMKSVMDAVDPGLTSPEKEDWAPTLLMPFRGLSRHRSSSSRLSSIWVGGGNDRQ